MTVDIPDDLPPLEVTDENIAAVRALEDPMMRAAWCAKVLLVVAGGLSSACGLRDEPGRIGIVLELTRVNGGAIAYGATEGVDGEDPRASELVFWVNTLRRAGEALGIPITFADAAEVKRTMAAAQGVTPLRRQQRRRNRG